MIKASKKYFLSYQYELEVPFFDVDSMDIVWHGHYVKYLEVARCAFLQALNYDYSVMRQQGYAWPVVQLKLKYVRPAVFGQKIVVDVFLKEYESCLKIDYVIRDKQTQQKLTEGSTMQMVIEIQSRQTQFQTPSCWRKVVEQAIAQGIDSLQPMSKIGG